MKLNGLLSLLLAVAASCVGHRNDNSELSTSGELSPLVALCRSIDYTDTAAMHDKKMMEKRIEGIVELLPITDSIAASEALGIFFDGIKHDPTALQEATGTADRYLNNPASPVRNESLYRLVLQSLLATDSLPEAVRTRAEDRLRRASLNVQGTMATDFRFVTREGAEGSLHGFDAPQTMLVFYDPECPHCQDILDVLAAQPIINKAISQRSLGVLAIYAEWKRDVWDKTKAEMPASWTVGCDISGILDNDLYDLPAMPLIYLLDADHRVTLKDPELSTLCSYLFCQLHNK